MNEHERDEMIREAMHKAIAREADIIACAVMLTCNEQGDITAYFSNGARALSINPNK